MVKLWIIVEHSFWQGRFADLCFGSAAATMKCDTHSLAVKISELRNLKTNILTCKITQHQPLPLH